MAKFESKYDLGDEVFLKTDRQKQTRIVTQVTFNPGNVRYSLSHEATDSWHYEMEMEAAQYNQNKAGFTK